jgi:hypothetical protein
MWREGQQFGEMRFDPVAAPDLVGVAAGLLEVFKGLDQLLPAADQGVAGAFSGTALAEDAPGDGLGDAERFLQGTAVDPV